MRTVTFVNPSHRLVDAFSSTSRSAFVPLSFFTDPATPLIYTLSLHDALPIWSTCSWARSESASRFRSRSSSSAPAQQPPPCRSAGRRLLRRRDRKSTRLNSSHVENSYAVFCLKKKNCYQPRLQQKLHDAMHNH